MLEIAAINLTLRHALMTDDTIVPITNMLDGLNEETDDPAQATTFVVGPCSDGNWRAAPVSNYIAKAH